MSAAGMSSDGASTLRDANRVRRAHASASSEISGASHVGLWILGPLAIGGLAYVLVGMAILFPQDGGYPEFSTVTWIAWLVITLAFQTLYWAFVAIKAKQSPARGLWALLPFIALVPTWGVARDALLGGAEGGKS